MSHHEFETILCINNTEITVTVDFDYQPKERATYFYPGCNESVTINSVKMEGEEIPDWVFNCFEESIEEDAIEHVHKVYEQWHNDKYDYFFDARKYA